MQRLFELVTPSEWDDAVAKGHAHNDVAQAFQYLREQPKESTRVRVPENMPAENKRHVVLEYARRRGLDLETMVCDGWIYIRMRRVDTAKRGPRKKHA